MIIKIDTVIDGTLVDLSKIIGSVLYSGAYSVSSSKSITYREALTDRLVTRVKVTVEMLNI